MNRIKNKPYKKWTYKKWMYKKIMYKKWTYKKWNYKKWMYKKRTYKKRTYKKNWSLVHCPETIWFIKVDKTQPVTAEQIYSYSTSMSSFCLLVYSTCLAQKPEILVLVHMYTRSVSVPLMTVSDIHLMISNQYHVA